MQYVVHARTVGSTVIKNSYVFQTVQLAVQLAPSTPAAQPFSPNSPSSSCRCSNDPLVAAYISGLHIGFALRSRFTSAPLASSSRITSVRLASLETAACSGAKPSVGCSSSGSDPAWMSLLHSSTSPRAADMTRGTGKGLARLVLLSGLAPWSSSSSAVCGKGCKQ